MAKRTINYVGRELTVGDEVYVRETRGYRRCKDKTAEKATITKLGTRYMTVVSRGSELRFPLEALKVGKVYPAVETPCEDWPVYEVFADEDHLTASDRYGYRLFAIKEYFDRHSSGFRDGELPPDVIDTIYGLLYKEADEQEQGD